MNRRDLFLGAVGAGLLGVKSAGGFGPSRSPFGICIYSFGATRKFTDTIAFLEHCRQLGAAGIQMPLTSLDAGFAEEVRAIVSKYGMYYEGVVTLPKNDPAQFEQQVIAAKRAGATVVRGACLSGRRYETFRDLGSWQQFVRESDASLAGAIPVLERHKISLALENHKDWTTDEMLELLRRHESEHLGVCLDFGNNIALAEEPGHVEKLARFAISTHVKDIAVERTPDGFRMVEVPLGRGIVNVSRMVSLVRAARPETRFILEMITRDPLSIPCLTDGYWATFPERKATYLPKAMDLVNSRGVGAPLPLVSSMAPIAQEQLADRNLQLCLDYGRAHDLN